MYIVAFVILLLNFNIAFCDYNRPTSLVVYVSVNGSDSSGNGNMTSPFATLNRALNEIISVKSGTIYLLQGRYYNQTLTTSYADLQLQVESYGEVVLENLEMDYGGKILVLQNLSIPNCIGSLHNNTALYIRNSTVQNIRINQLSKNSSLILHDSIFREGAVLASNSNIQSSNCSFLGLSIILFSRIESLIIENCKFLGNKSPLQIGSTYTIISSSLFQDNVGQNVGAFYTEAIGTTNFDNLIVNSTAFINNTAMGYDNLSPVAAITIKSSFIHCYFSCNKANASTLVPPLTENTEYPINLINNTYDTQCMPECNKGEFSRMHLVKCKRCNAGYYTNITTARTCTPCDLGYSTLGMNGAEKCSPCSSGTAAPKEGTADCKSCPPGYFSFGSVCVDCSPCEPGQHQPNYRQIECLPCPTGSVSQKASSVCRICGEGSYANTSTCLDCDMWWTSKAGSTSCPDPSWRMVSLIIGLIAIVVLGVGIFLIRKQKHRAGYWAVRSIIYDKEQLN